MSSFTSDEEGGDELEIKPPQAQLSASRDRRGRDRDRYSSTKSKEYSSSRRVVVEERYKKEFETSSIPRNSQRIVVIDRHRSGSSHQDRGDRSSGAYGRSSERDGGSSSGSRSHRKHSDKYLSDSKSRRSDDRHKDLEEQKIKRKNIEEESERYFRELERKREQERREEAKRHEGRIEKRIVNRSRSITPPHLEEEEDQFDHDEHEDSRIDPKIDRSRDGSKDILSKGSVHHFPEVEDIEESSSGLEDGEQISPQRSNSDVSDSDNEKPDDRKQQQPNLQDDNLHSDLSDRRSSSRSPSESPTDSKPSSKSSDSEQESRVERRNGGSDNNGERPSKIFKGDSPGSPDSDNEPRKPGSDVEILEGNSHDKITTGNSESAEVEEATDVLNLLPPYYPALQGCRRVEEFKLLNRIEEGTYGVVYRAEDRRTSEIVALKRLKMEKEKDGFPITSLREINTLLKAQHENIVTVREIVVGSNTDKIFLVMDYVEHDLKSLMETLKQKGQAFIVSEVKCLMIQLLRAVAHLHDNWILHRDLKTSNLLLSHKGILKVGDFGLAREYGSPLKQYTPIVVTLWYRAPELLLQMKDYSCPIDVWSVGCIFGELLKMEPMFPGKSEANQLNLIFQRILNGIACGGDLKEVIRKKKRRDGSINELVSLRCCNLVSNVPVPQKEQVFTDLNGHISIHTFTFFSGDHIPDLWLKTLGTPNDKIWPGYTKLPLLQKMTFADYPVNKLKTRFHRQDFSDTGIDLMNKFLTFNPAKRITAEDALKHKFFEEPPLPIDPSVFPTWPAKSEMGHHRKAAAASPKPPSGGRQFKDLRDDDADATGFFLGGVGDKRPAIGPGFSLKF